MNILFAMEYACYVLGVIILVMSILVAKYAHRTSPLKKFLVHCLSLITGIGLIFFGFILSQLPR